MSTMGYFRIAATIPKVKPAAIRDNAKAIIQMFMKACDEGAELVLFPELALTAYTCGDLFLQSQLIQETEKEAIRIIEQSSARGALMIFGMPLSREGKLFNVAVVVRGGNEILGVIPKTYIPNSREYYENRWFASSDEASFDEISIGNQVVPFGTNLLFQHEDHKKTTFSVELCEDLWAPIPPSSHQAISGSQILFNLSASNDLVGKADYRRKLIAQQSARCLSGYVYTSAGSGESTTDAVFGGHALIAENGVILTESSRFSVNPELAIADIDVDLLDHERRISRTFSQSARRENHDRIHRRIQFGGRLHYHRGKRTPIRPIDPHPFVPHELTERDARCSEISNIQAIGLATRLEHIGMKKVVIGLSGGLDSTLALLVTVKAFERMNLPREGIVSITMPGLGTSQHTLGNVKKLCDTVGINLETINIHDSCKRQMEELKHSGEPKDVAYENIQARYRTSLLMNRANMVNGLLVGTGDLSELALGWCTYNGDHMSMYCVNVGVPKTLVRYMVQWFADNGAHTELKCILEDILNTPVSPELLPPDKEGNISQKTEEVIGPYELHDFFLYHAIRHGFQPNKVLHMAVKAFEKIYEEKEIRHWLRFFYKRFFSQQFKRSCLPDGPKVGSVALSPRGDWRMPSDAEVGIWLEELEDENL